MRIAAIAFDLDGTLVDSAAGVTHALNVALSVAGLRRFELDTVRSWIGDGPDALILRALQACQLRDVDQPTLTAQLRHSFDTATLREPMGEGAAYQGIAELLQSLAPDYPMTVVTNKPTPLARAVLESAGLLNQFVAVHGADWPTQRKPSPLLIQQAARQMELPVGSVLMVGDGPADLQAARAAGSPCAWVRWGYGQAPETPTAAVWQLDAPRDLMTRLQQTQQAQIL